MSGGFGGRAVPHGAAQAVALIFAAAAAQADRSHTTVASSEDRSVTEPDQQEQP